MSMGSIAEVSSCLDLAGIFGLISGKDEVAMKELLKHSYYQINKLP